MVEDNSLGKIFFGSVGKKMAWAFGILIFLLLIMGIFTYLLSSRIQADSIYIDQVNNPLQIMVQKVIGYDSILTLDAHDALIHAENGEWDLAKGHWEDYDSKGILLDNILKKDAPNLINKSRRSGADKQKVYNILSELDKYNSALVDLEIRSFEEEQRGNLSGAYSLIISSEYDSYKKQLADYYNQWYDEETRIGDYYKQRILTNSKYVLYINLYSGIFFILVAIGVSVFVFRKINNPLGELYYAASEIKKGDYKTKLNIRTGDQLEDLGNVLNETSEKLDRIEQERKQLDSAKTEFLSITSHELRSPMTPMKAQLQMLMGDYFGKLSQKQKEALDIVLRNTERLDKIIVDFLEISRIEAARLKFNFVKSDLTEHIKRLKEEMDGFLPEKNIKVVLNLEKLPKIEVDPDRTMQVLRNLINNAKKFTPDNGTIEVRARVDRKMILFSVKDSGLGIPKKDQIRIFEPFYQVDNMYQHKSGGTGLGLAICKGIVESQKGRIWFESAEGKGTTFYFTVPLEPVRNIGAIKLLFSSKEEVEGKIKEIFLEMLGPIGESEFTDIKLKGLVENELLEYVDDLKKNKILEHTEEFKRKIRLVFEGERKKSDRSSSNSGDVSVKDISEYIKKE